MKRPLRYIAIALFAFLSIVTFISCPAAPPVDPIDEYNPNGAPAGPKNVKATNGYEGTITLTWDPVDNATSYQIWMIETSNFGTVVDDETNQIQTRNELEKRGFRHVDDVDGATLEYKVNTKGSKAYIFSIIAVRNLADKSGSAASLVYSSPSNFVEGSSVVAYQGITLTGIANSSEIRIYWDVPNIFSILEGNQKPLYKYDFSVSYKLTSEDDHRWVTLDQKFTDFSLVLKQSDYGFSPNESYDFQISMNIYDENGQVINTPSSAIYPVFTDSNLIMQPMRSVNVTQGSELDGVLVSWTYPTMPAGASALKAYQIERKAEKENDWKLVLEPTADNSSGTTSSWLDTTAEDNTKYEYRVYFGYIEDNAYIMQDNPDEVTKSDTLGWKLWIPENITAKMEGDSVLIEWEYKKQAGDTSTGQEWKLIKSTWGEKTGQNKEDTISINDIETCMYTDPVSLPSGESYQEFSYKFILTYNGKNIEFPITVTNGPLSIGATTADSVISFTASTDYVGEIRLNWTLKEGFDDSEISYFYSTTDGEVTKQAIPADKIDKDGQNRSYTIPTDKAHSYRLSLNDSNIAIVAAGDVLAAPTNLKASQGTYGDRIELSFDKKTNYTTNVELLVEIFDPSSSKWVAAEGVSTDLANGKASIPASSLPITSNENERYGSSYNFRIAVRNKSVPDAITEKSNENNGNVLGAYGMGISTERYVDKNEYRITWEKQATGATGYEIFARLKDRGEYVSVADISNTTTTQRGIDYNRLATSGLISSDKSAPNYSHNPISEEYEFKLVPTNANVSAKDIIDYVEPVCGILFCPPANISATKGQGNLSIEISWDGVGDNEEGVKEADRYIIYKYSDSSMGESSLLGTYEVRSSNKSRYTYNDDSPNPNGDTYYNIVSVRNLDTGTTYESVSQTGFENIETMYKTIEPANLGYILEKPMFSSIDDELDGTYYKPYITIKWSRSREASEYVIGNELLTDEESIIDVSELPYSSEAAQKNSIITNGIESDVAGYLAYDYSDGTYTYNDNRGTLTDSLTYTGYVIRGTNASGSSETDERSKDNSYTRAIKEEEYINFINLEISYHITQSKITDWAPSTAFGTIPKYNKQGIDIVGCEWNDLESGYIKFAEYDSIVIKNIKLNTDSNLLLSAVPDPTWGTGNGTNDINWIGDPNNNASFVTITVPEHYFDARVSFNKISKSTTNGSYDVFIQDLSGVYPTQGRNVLNSSELISPFGDR